MKSTVFILGLLILGACDFSTPEQRLLIKEGETYVLNANEVLVFEKVVSDNRCGYVNPCDTENGAAEIRMVYQEKYQNRWHSTEHQLSTKSRKFLGVLVHASFESVYERFSLMDVIKNGSEPYEAVFKVEDIPYDDTYYDTYKH